MSPEASERERVRDHLSRVERELREAPPPGLSEALQARRLRAIGVLRGYTAAGRFPVNEVSHDPTPVFVDAHGSRCAVAALLDATGGADLTARIAGSRNLARVEELAEDPDLVQWLKENGLSLSEAARIQPAYHALPEVSWQPTVSVMAGALAGANTTDGFQVAFAPALRAGVRRVTQEQTRSGSVRYSSVALVAEYTRGFFFGYGAAHHAALMVAWEPSGFTRDVQWYVLGGLVMAIDDDAFPGRGFGAAAGVGFSFRTRTFPFFAELVAHGLAQTGGASLRAGPNLGIVF